MLDNETMNTFYWSKHNDVFIEQPGFFGSTPPKRNDKKNIIVVTFDIQLTGNHNGISFRWDCHFVLYRLGVIVITTW